MTLSLTLIPAAVGSLSGLHTAIWGMYKDSAHEGFGPIRFARSILIGAMSAVIIQTLLLLDLSQPGQLVLLFGLAYGFLVWMAGPVTALEWVMGRPVVTGAPAQGLFFAHLLWGLLVGLLFPRIHRPLQAGLHDVEPHGRLSPRRSR